MKNNKQKPSKLLGLGLDNKDGHKRITQAERFSIVEETHHTLTEVAIKTFETLDKKANLRHSRKGRIK